MAKGITLAIALLALTAGQAYAGKLTPGPEMGDGFLGLIVVAALVAGFFAFRYYRNRSA